MGKIILKRPRLMFWIYYLRQHGVILLVLEIMQVRRHLDSIFFLYFLLVEWSFLSCIRIRWGGLSAARNGSASSPANITKFYSSCLSVSVSVSVVVKFHFTPIASVAHKLKICCPDIVKYNNNNNRNNNRYQLDICVS